MKRLSFIAMAILMVASNQLFAADWDGTHITESSVGIGTKWRTVGPLFGFEYNYRPSERFMIGGVGYTGQITGTATGSVTMGGVCGTYLWNFANPRLRLEISLLIGASGGISNSSQFGGTILEPNVRLNIDLGGNVRVGINAGFNYFPASMTNGGIEAGIQFQFYNLFTTKPVLSQVQ